MSIDRNEQREQHHQEQRPAAAKPEPGQRVTGEQVEIVVPSPPAAQAIVVR